jgi:hypothetical protein
MFKRRPIRLLVVLLIFFVSCWMLAWAFVPLRHQILSLPINPVNLQLPVPQSWLPYVWVCI